MSTKNVTKLLILLILLNLSLLSLGIYLFQVPDPSDIVRFSRTYVVGVNAIILLVNLGLYRKVAQSKQHMRL